MNISADKTLWELFTMSHWRQAEKTLAAVAFFLKLILFVLGTADCLKRIIVSSAVLVKCQDITLILRQ